MERLLARLERRFGRYAIPNLIVFVIGGMALVWAVSFQHPETQIRLMLDWRAVARGQMWRLVTFLFVPPSSSTFSLFLNLYFMWWVGTSLEQHWGAFKFNVYYFTGVIGAIAAAFVTGAASNVWLNDASLLLAFATLFPDVEILLFFILPIRVKWLGILSAAATAYFFATGNWATRASIVASLAGYLLFFSGHWWDVWRRRGVVVRQKARRRELASDASALGQRVCAICGASEADGADIRVCSCEKCGGKPRALCLEHSRNH
jgi:membrane associated rhomboid family serine protease